jgi:hypothetical protein
MPNYLTQDDVNTYGTDLIDLTQRAAHQALAPTLDFMQQQNARLQQQLAREAKARIDLALDAAIPNWQQIGQSQQFIDWLRQVDNLNGRPRQMLLNEATVRGDASAVIAMFKAYLADKWAAGQGGAQAPTQSRRMPEWSSEKPVYTGAQIAKFYDQHRRGAYRGREAEWARQEQDFYLAQKEGRVIGGVQIERGK